MGLVCDGAPSVGAAAAGTLIKRQSKRRRLIPRIKAEFFVASSKPPPAAYGLEAVGVSPVTGSDGCSLSHR
jgi:hypothetical protein